MSEKKKVGFVMLEIFEDGSMGVETNFNPMVLKIQLSRAYEKAVLEASNYKPDEAKILPIGMPLPKSNGHG